MDEELKTQEEELLDNGLPEEGPTTVQPVIEKPTIDKWVPPEVKRFRDSRGVIYAKNPDGSLRRELPKEDIPKKKLKVPYKPST